MKVYVEGSFPSPFYRAFNEEKYARSFVEKGIFRMRRLKYYREIEDRRREDRGEGEGFVVFSMERPVYTLDQSSQKVISKRMQFGPVNRGILDAGLSYILCFSGPQVDIKHLACQYGRYVVRVDQPEALVCDISSYLEQYSNVGKNMWLDCVQVRYDKGQTVSALPDPVSHEWVRMSYGQKDPKFSSDCEYRLVLTLPFTVTRRPREIKGELNKRLEYAEIL